MADKKKDETPEEETEGKGGGSKKLIMIVALLVVLGGGGGAAFFMMKGGDEEAAGEQAEAPKVEELGPPALVSMETFMVNIYDPEGDRHAKLKLDLAVVPAGVATTVAGDTLMQAKLRDRVLTLLTSKSFDELRSPVGKEGFRREVKARLNPLFEAMEEEGAQIDEVLFSEFVVQ